MATAKKIKRQEKVFDYRALRLLMGLIAIALPLVVVFLSNEQLSSISASYHSDTVARDFFVGFLFIIGALCWAYKGHTPNEALASKIAAIAAVIVAIFPTSCDGCDIDAKTIIHYCAAAVLFGILAYFCFVAFRKKIKGETGRKGRRNRIYFSCGCIIIACMLAMIVSRINIFDEEIKRYIVFYSETLALYAFGIAWIVAGKFIPFFVNKKEALRLFR